ncbi:MULTISPECIES: ROK family transcriptional regulator [Cryobacterium]|uniref:ROK family transcriptional regulator n=1 Tax=Cryobacterium TaxID=69578 RepID=UPI000CD45FF7|nr:MULTISPECIES: ROK family transcriptional regulator [Cryobacterium]POH63682.1 ROK family protein [Cryobacterium zongtaii]TFC40814.1 ROK family protein [Cryobacterium sp. TMN-39-2]
MLNAVVPESRASLHAMLDFAWAAGAFVSTDAMEATGLTRSTAIAALDELINFGLLRELPNSRAVGQYSKGRPARRFELRPEAAVVIGMDAGRSHLTTTVADLRGVPLAQETTELTAANEGTHERRAAVVAAIDSALIAAGRSRTEVLAACVGVPSPVDSHGRSPEQREGFWRRMNPDLRELLEEWVPIVRVENDASLAAVAEGATGAAVGLENFVVLLAGDRLGAGVVVDGHLLRGAHGGVGEMKAFDFVFGVESAAGIGLKLTDWVVQAATSGHIPPGHPLTDIPTEQLTGRAVLDLARQGDPWSRGLVERAGALLARVTAVFGSLYDPERVIVSGAVADGLAEVIEVARARLPTELDLPAPDLRQSLLGASAVATGAVSAALEAARTDVLRLSAEELRWREAAS